MEGPRLNSLDAFPELFPGLVVAVECKVLVDEVGDCKIVEELLLDSLLALKGANYHLHEGDIVAPCLVDCLIQVDAVS